MQIQINTDRNIEGHEVLAAQVTGVVESALSRLSDHITRVEVHLSDENSDKKGGNDNMRCMMEARIEGRQPIAVTHQAATLDQAVDGECNWLEGVQLLSVYLIIVISFFFLPEPAHVQNGKSGAASRSAISHSNPESIQPKTAP